jgi:5-methyltetrahydropteroyltriglutamate--homocysteine methyltransferase
MMMKSFAVPRAENVGSLLRPGNLKKASEHHEGLRWEGRERERERDLARLRELEDAAIKSVVTKQEAAGLDVITDGEFRRYQFTRSFYDAVSGLTYKHKFKFRNDKGEEVETPPAASIVGRLTKRSSPGAEEAKFLASLTSKAIKVTFPAASWFASFNLFAPNASIPGYESVDEGLEHIMSILRELIRESIDAGATYIQLDYPSYIYLVDDKSVDLMKQMSADKDKMVRTWIDMDKRVIANMPEHVRFGMHLCRGNYKSYWMLQGSLDPIAGPFFSLPYDTFLVEWEDTAREGDFSALKRVPKGKAIVAMGWFQANTLGSRARKRFCASLTMLCST